MTIKRIGVTSEYGPLMSRAVIYGHTVMLSGVVAGDLSQDTEAQTREILRTIDRLLAEASTNRNNVLTAHIWLSDMANFQQMNVGWNDWVDAAAPPARTCVSGELYHPDCKVEITVTAVTEN